ncbi:hypothetical protein IAU59_003922 [Kwoniella sp. CBS 9459]
MAIPQSDEFRRLSEKEYLGIYDEVYNRATGSIHEPSVEERTSVQYHTLRQDVNGYVLLGTRTKTTPLYTSMTYGPAPLTANSSQRAEEVINSTLGPALTVHKVDCTYKKASHAVGRRIRSEDEVELIKRWAVEQVSKREDWEAENGIDTLYPTENDGTDTDTSAGDEKGVDEGGDVSFAQATQRSIQTRLTTGMGSADSDQIAPQMASGTSQTYGDPNQTGYGAGQGSHGDYSSHMYHGTGSTGYPSEPPPPPYSEYPPPP